MQGDQISGELAAGDGAVTQSERPWHPISTAPVDRVVELGQFPVEAGVEQPYPWLGIGDFKLMISAGFQPTHWREAQQLGDRTSDSPNAKGGLRWS